MYKSCVTIAKILHYFLMAYVYLVQSNNQLHRVGWKPVGSIADCSCLFICYWHFWCGLSSVNMHKKQHFSVNKYHLICTKDVASRIEYLVKIWVWKPYKNMRPIEPQGSNCIFKATSNSIVLNSDYNIIMGIFFIKLGVEFELSLSYCCKLHFWLKAYVLKRFHIHP